MNIENTNKRKTMSDYFEGNPGKEYYKKNINDIDIYSHIFSRLEALESQQCKENERKTPDYYFYEFSDGKKGYKHDVSHVDVFQHIFNRIEALEEKEKEYV